MLGWRRQLTGQYIRLLRERTTNTHSVSPITSFPSASSVSHAHHHISRTYELLKPRPPLSLSSPLFLSTSIYTSSPSTPSRQATATRPLRARMPVQPRTTRTAATAGGMPLSLPPSSRRSSATAVLRCHRRGGLCCAHERHQQTQPQRRRAGRAGSLAMGLVISQGRL